MARANPVEVLRQSRAQAHDYAQSVGVKRVRALLAKAQLELNHRITRAEGLGGSGKGSFTAMQMRTALEQISDLLKKLNGPLKGLLLDQTAASAEASAQNTLKYLERAEKKFHGMTARLPIDEVAAVDAAKQGANASILRRIASDPHHPRRPGILARYDMNVIDSFEERLRLGLIQLKPWGEMRADIIAESPFLQSAPAHWAERLVRTETMAAYNRAGWETTRQAQDELGDMVKILSATVDDRTGWDSIQVHGQIRKPEQAFEWDGGLYQHPPNRPNDREIVVPHRIAWPIPDYLRPLPDAMVEARWVADGRRGAPPPRPPLTTVPLERFGH